jgi:hypothetical protein
MWEPRHLTTLWVSAVCNRDSFTHTFVYCDKESKHIMSEEQVFLFVL